LLKNNKKVFVFNPFNNKHKILTKDDVAGYEKKTKAALAAFIRAKNIGVLVSTKSGQNRLKEAEDLENKFPDKDFTILAADTFNFQSLEDFNFIDVFVNTACPRIAYDESEKITKPAIDIEELIHLSL
jgi:2-(3-amino-3-carboxypropyl)histidine synthase